MKERVEYNVQTFTPRAPPSEASSEEEEEVEDQRILRTYRKLMERVGITKKHARYVPLFEKARKLGVGEASGRKYRELELLHPVDAFTKAALARPATGGRLPDAEMAEHGHLQRVRLPPSPQDPRKHVMADFFPGPVNVLQNTVSNRTHCNAQLRPGSSFLLSALRFLDRFYEPRTTFKSGWDDPDNRDAVIDPVLAAQLLRKKNRKKRKAAKLAEKKRAKALEKLKLGKRRVLGAEDSDVSSVHSSDLTEDSDEEKANDKLPSMNLKPPTTTAEVAAAMALTADQEDKKDDSRFSGVKSLERLSMTLAQTAKEKKRLPPAGLAANPGEPKPKNRGADRFFSYVGDWEAGAMQGFGEYTFHDGGLYKGKWEQNKQNGKGKARYLCGSTYEGQWRNGKWNGKGRYIDKNRVTPVKILPNTFSD